MGSYRELTAWQLSVELAKHIYKLTAEWPNSEQFGLTSQANRASVSVAANIAEGHGRSSYRDFRRFLLMAQGSLSELETLITIAMGLEYITIETEQQILNRTGEIGRVMNGLRRYLEAKENV